MKHLFSAFVAALIAIMVYSCLPPSDPYPHEPPAQIINRAQQWSDSLEDYIRAWTQQQVGDSIPDYLIPDGVADSRDFYLKHPDSVTAAETWAVRYAKPINKDSLYAGIPDPKITYLFLGTALAPFGSKLIIEGEFPHCRFFSLQISPPLNGTEYYAQRQFGTAEVSVVDADIEPLPGHTNPFRLGANRNAVNRSYRYEFDLTTGDPVALNDSAHQYPYREQGLNKRSGGLLVYQGPLGYKTIAGTPLPAIEQGDWNLGCLWLRIYEPDDNVDALGGVPMPKIYYELPTGERYFIGSNFSRLQQRADMTIANRVTVGTPNPNFGPHSGWYKSWGITRSILNGICQANGWNRIDSGARVRDIELGWTGRGEFQPGAGKIEPHATTNNYASYLGRSLAVPPGMVAVLTGKLPTFPSTRNGEATMTSGEVRYWSICGIDADPLSPLPATTIHAITDDDVIIDNNRNYVIAYSRVSDRPSNANTANGVTWVDWGTQTEVGLLMRWVCVAPFWRFAYAPHEHQLDFSHSDWAGTLYDSTLIGQNWRNGFMQCYLPRVHYMTVQQFQALGNSIRAEQVPVWVDSTYTHAGPAESQLGTVSATTFLDTTIANAASNMNDGNVNTAWSSAWGQPATTATIDLGAVKNISAVKLYWDWIFFAKDYNLRVSNDNMNWTTVATATNENGQIDLYRNLSGVSGRYVQLQLINYNVGYYRLGEFEVYISDCDCSAPLTSIASSTASSGSAYCYPNPTSGNLQVHFGNAEGGQIEIFDISGKLIYSGIRVPENSFIDISDQPKGLYIIRMRSKGSIHTHRVLKL